MKLSDVLTSTRNGDPWCELCGVAYRFGIGGGWAYICGECFRGKLGDVPRRWRKALARHQWDAADARAAFIRAHHELRTYRQYGARPGRLTAREPEVLRAARAELLGRNGSHE